MILSSAGLSSRRMPAPRRIGAMCRSISSIRPSPEQLPPDGRREHRDVLPACRVEGDLHRLLDRAAEGGDTVGRPGVLQVARDYEDRAPPCAAVRAGITDGTVEAVGCSLRFGVVHSRLLLTACRR